MLKVNLYKTSLLSAGLFCLFTHTAWAKLDLVDPPRENQILQKVVAAIEQYDIMDVYPDQTFQGNRNFTRYELADALARGSHYLQKTHQLKINMDYRMGSYLQAYFAPSGDIPGRHWARRQIEMSMALGLISGDQRLAFHGLQRVTRYQLAQSLWNMYSWLQLSPLTINEKSVDDVPEDHWAAEAVKKLIEAGILYPDLDGRFHGDRKVKREELADALSRTLEQIDFIAQQQGGLKPRDVQPLPDIFRRPRYDGRHPPFGYRSKSGH